MFQPQGKRSTLPVLAATAVLLCAAPPLAAAADSPDAREGVYFLGVDAGPAPQALAAAGDRWAFSDFARQTLEAANVTRLTDSLADWRPLEDPFNVGVVVITDLETSSVAYRGRAYRYFATAELVWLHVGQDRQGIGMARPFPEVRAVITHQHTAYGEGSQPFGEEDLRHLETSAIRQGIEQLAGHVAVHQARTLVRNALAIRYVTVTPARPLLERARRDLADTLAITSEQDADAFQQRVARLGETMVMQEVNRSPELGNVVVLPGRDILDVLMDLWPAYARRVFALSGDSGARRVLGEEPPRIRVVADACPAEPDPRLIRVPGWHIRTTLAALDVSSRKLSPYVLGDHVRLVVAVAVRAARSNAGDAGIQRETAIGTGQTDVDQPLQRPRELTLQYSLNHYEMGILLRKAIRAALPKLTDQLRQLERATLDSKFEGNICDEPA